MSEAVTVRCSGCNAKLRIKSRKANGKKIVCPKCEHEFVIQLPATEPESSSVSAAATQAPAAKSPNADAATPSSAAKASSAGASAAAELPDLDSAESSEQGTLVSWEEGIGDDKKYHIGLISSAGITHVLKLKDYEQFTHAVATATASPDEAEDILLQLPKAGQISADELAKATYAEKLNQLTLFKTTDEKVKVPEGKEQADFFAAIKQHLGGAESEEEADAWSVMQSPLFILAVIAVIGGFMIWFTTICDPNYEASGRRSGMKQLLNWVGYKIGPLWMSVAVGSLAALVLAMMIYNLIKRPIRQVLEF